MKSLNLLYIALVLAGMCLGWTFLESQSALESFRNASQHKDECEELVAEIRFLRDENGGSIAIAPSVFDPSSIVTQAARDAHFPMEGFRVGQSTESSIEGTGIRLWRVEIPPAKISLPQAARMINNLSASEMRYQVRSLKLTAVSQNSGDQELWDTEFNIGYLKNEPE